MLNTVLILAQAGDFLNRGARTGVPEPDQPARLGGMNPLRAAFENDDQRYEAVLNRDATAVGAFVYAVRTTGIYCLPTCAARRPRRENVVFYPSPVEAERAGFRACRKCDPKGQGGCPEQIVQACRLLEQAERSPSLQELADLAGLSRFHFQRLFKQAVGLTPKAYANAVRAKRMQAELRRSNSVTEAIYEAGYDSGSRFYSESDRVLGMTPTRFQQGGAGEVIRFAVGECSLGSILVASTMRGVCAILMGGDPDELARDLQRRFPRAELIGGDVDYERTVAEVIAFVEQPGPNFTLPLDIRGTAFQQQVWKALGEVLPGQTVSYAELAAKLGRPEAVRAVAGACAANAHAVAIPCHRVVRTDGSLSGYRWGVERKRELLQRERRHASQA